VDAFPSLDLFDERLSPVLQAGVVRFAFTRQPRPRPLRTASALPRGPRLAELERLLGVTRTEAGVTYTEEELAEAERRALGRRR
jgi:hypothetical protein